MGGEDGIEKWNSNQNSFYLADINILYTLYCAWLYDANEANDMGLGWAHTHTDSHTHS